ncbi:MAG: haloacid dehalogenase-like hydrolase [Verrucomicrobia bacterium]|nr:haloacid dehalogenase-like hydrolase [Verrucomicrobiota bacterium]
MPEENHLYRQNIVACVWDFDKTLIPGYMQWPIFQHYGVDEKAFWREVNALPETYARMGQRVSRDTIYLNHILTYVRLGLFPKLNNRLLRELGAMLHFYPGLPQFFQTLKNIPKQKAEYRKYDIEVEHYVISTGLAEMIRGSSIAPLIEEIYGCEFIENPLEPGFIDQETMPLESEAEIAQVGMMVDNTLKTRFIFEINKGTNKNSTIDVNSKLQPEDRRIPMHNMIYIADGPSDVPVFSVIRKQGGRAYAVYESGNPKEFAQNDALLRGGRVDAYGRADYREKSDTHMWLCMHVQQICDRIVADSEQALSRRVGAPPRHIHKDDPLPEPRQLKQEHLFDA